MRFTGISLFTKQYGMACFIERNTLERADMGGLDVKVSSIPTPSTSHLVGSFPGYKPSLAGLTLTVGCPPATTVYADNG